jgi:uncharacterized protein
VQLLDGQLILSAGDLVGFSECRHLAHLERERAHGRFRGALTRDETADLVARKGEEHERAHLQRLREAGLAVEEIELDRGSVAGLRAAAEGTLDAMRRGVDVVYQGVLLSAPWRGYADFLMRLETPSALGAWSYEVADAKLAYRVKPYFVVQLCLYSEMLGEAQGLPPESLRLVLGSGLEVRHRVADFAPYVRRLKARYRQELAAGFPGTYPDPVEHCGICDFGDHCGDIRVADDHLSLVAHMRRSQTARLADAGIITVAGLAAMAPALRPPGISPGALAALREQAELQVHQRETGELRYELLTPEEGHGFARMPPPDPGDVVLDLEGDPFFEGGSLEYLFGVGWEEGGEWRFQPFWGCDRAGERHAFEALMDWLGARLAEHPSMHVYHYAPYEPTALKRLMGFHGTREDAVDRLLREARLVDLYGVVRQSMRISQPSYSIKLLEAFYGFERTAGVGAGGDSILAFEQFLDSGDRALLDEIAAYNEEDCRSTLALVRWLHERRAEAIGRFGPIPWATPPDVEVEREEPDGLVGRLLADVPADWAPDPEAAHLGLASAEQHLRWLMAQLLRYHRREAKPAWWQYFARLDMDAEQLVEDPEAIGGLVPDQGVEPVPVARSFEYALGFPAQEHRISAGGSFEDPATGRSLTVTAVDDGAGILRVKRGKGLHGEPLPAALVPGGPLRTPEQRDALRRVAEALLPRGSQGPGAFRAARSILAAGPPRIAGHRDGDALLAGGADPQAVGDLVRRLDDDCLVVQGPPGSGKTWTGARAIVDLLEDGLRVGVASTSHKAIHNLLHEVERVAHERGIRFAGLKKASSGHDDSFFASGLDEPMIDNSTTNTDFPPGPEVTLVAGTGWLFAREELDDSLDVLVIDEAGQVALADALAMATSAGRVLLLGDPRQLAHVSQGSHPPGVGVSVLEHLLGDRATVPPDRGVFLERTWRLHPDVCRFVSEAVYEGRLVSEASCAGQVVDGPEGQRAGVRFMAVRHRDNARSSPEEAAAIAAAIDGLLGAGYTDAQGRTRPLAAEDVMVVAPYNAQVRCLRNAVPPGVRVGTVDKFQGQEAPVVFFSMATSSGDDVPRDLAFLLSLNRLNVAVSRARALAIVVASPQLLDVRCRSISDMRLASALCLLAELAAEQEGAPLSTVSPGGARRGR